MWHIKSVIFAKFNEMYNSTISEKKGENEIKYAKGELWSATIGKKSKMVKTNYVNS